MIMLPVSATTLFSNNFEDGNLDAEVGTFTITNGDTSFVSTDSTDATLGDFVGLIDQTTPAASLDVTLGLTSAGSLAAGEFVSLSFDFAARRTNGFSKTIYVDALNAANAVVARFILGDANAFGNGNGDRQRPGYQPTDTGASGGREVLPAAGTPGSYWWGADTSIATFDVTKDAHFELLFGASSFDVSTTNQGIGANTYSTTGLSNFNSVVASEIASIRFHSASDSAGFWIDNIVVDAVPEPSTVVLSLLGGLGLCLRRR
jgi:hypothetical protein